MIDPFLPIGVMSFYWFDEEPSSALFCIFSKLGILVLTGNLGEDSLLDNYPNNFWFCLGFKGVGSVLFWEPLSFF